MKCVGNYWVRVRKYEKKKKSLLRMNWNMIPWLLIKQAGQPLKKKREKKKFYWSLEANISQRIEEKPKPWIYEYNKIISQSVDPYKYILRAKILLSVVLLLLSQTFVIAQANRNWAGCSNKYNVRSPLHVAPEKQTEICVCVWLQRKHCRLFKSRLSRLWEV